MPSSTAPLVAPVSDARSAFAESWTIEATGFSPENVELHGSKFLLGNGRLGCRGTLTLAPAEHVQRLDFRRAVLARRTVFRLPDGNEIAIKAERLSGPTIALPYPT